MGEKDASGQPSLHIDGLEKIIDMGGEKYTVGIGDAEYLYLKKTIVGDVYLTKKTSRVTCNLIFEVNSVKIVGEEQTKSDDFLKALQRGLHNRYFMTLDEADKELVPLYNALREIFEYYKNENDSLKKTVKFKLK